MENLFYLSENELKHLNEPELGYFVAESPNVIERALKAGFEPCITMVEERKKDKLPNKLNEYEAPVIVKKHDEMTSIKGYEMTRGALCIMKRKKLPTMENLLKDAKRVVVLENVVNPTNVGAIFRSAAAMGMDAVLLTYGCADPLYKRASRVSMGTVFQIPWAILDDYKNPWPQNGVTELKERGFKLLAMALSENSIGIDDQRIKNEDKMAIVLGTEGEGLKEDTLKACDFIVKIPMYHEVDSLNVAAASAVAFWELKKSNDK